MAKTAESFEGRIEIKAEAWSGNVNPWRGSVYIDGRFVKGSGFCKSEGRAIAAGRKLIDRAVALFIAQRESAKTPEPEAPAAAPAPTGEPAPGSIAWSEQMAESLEPHCSGPNGEIVCKAHAGSADCGWAPLRDCEIWASRSAFRLHGAIKDSDPLCETCRAIELRHAEHLARLAAGPAVIDPLLPASYRRREISFPAAVGKLARLELLVSGDLRTDPTGYAIERGQISAWRRAIATALSPLHEEAITMDRERYVLAATAPLSEPIDGVSPAAPRGGPWIEQARAIVKSNEWGDELAERIATALRSAYHYGIEDGRLS